MEAVGFLEKSQQKGKANQKEKPVKHKTKKNSQS